MFESVAAAVSPSRSHLAGPVAALAHGVVLAGLLGAALWNAVELPLPDPPERISIFPIALTASVGGGGEGGRRDAPPPRNRVKTLARANTFPTRPADDVGKTAGTELTQEQGPPSEQGESDVAGTGGNEKGSGDCPTCPVGPGSGEKGVVVDASVVAPVLIRRVEPNFPEALRKLRLEGRVVLEAIIARNGSIEEIRVVSSGNVLFTEEAVKAVGQWRYEPCLVAGRPVRVRLLVTVVFRLN